VNSNHNHTGDLITGIVDPSVFIADRVVIPRGTEAHVRLVLNRKGGRLHGKADVRLELVSLVLNKEKLDADRLGGFGARWAARRLPKVPFETQFEIEESPAQPRNRNRYSTVLPST
jgi:hypothetical protein